MRKQKVSKEAKEVKNKEWKVFTSECCYVFRNPTLEAGILTLEWKIKGNLENEINDGFFKGAWLDEKKRYIVFPFKATILAKNGLPVTIRVDQVVYLKQDLLEEFLRIKKILKEEA